MMQRYFDQIKPNRFMLTSNENKPLFSVSVVIPSRNRINLLKTALRSALSQTYSPKEVIVIDDASEDAFEYRRLMELDCRVKYFRNNTPLGPSGARNIGIDLAEGDLIAFLDDDDEWLPTKLEKQIQMFQNDTEIGAVYCLYSWRDLSTGKISYIPDENAHIKGWILRSQLIEDRTNGLPSYVVRKDLLKRVGCFDTNLKAREDWDLSIRLALITKFGLINEPLVIAGKSVTTGVTKQYINQIYALERIHNKYETLRRKLGTLIELKAKSKYYYDIGRNKRCIGKPFSGIYNSLLGIYYWPFCVSNYIDLFKNMLYGCFLLLSRTKKIKI